MNASEPPQDAPLPDPISPTAAPNRRRWWIHLVLLGAYPLVIGLAGLRRVGADEPALTHGTAGLLWVCAVELLIFAVVFGLAWLASHASAEDLLIRWHQGFWTIPLGIGYSIALRLVLGLLMILLAGVVLALRLATPESLRHFASVNAPDIQTLVDVSALRQNPVYFWLTLTLVSFVLGGCREELWRSALLAGLRALWPRRFSSRAGQIGSVAIAAMIFGFGHLPMGPLAACLTGLLGFGLGLIMVRHQSIWPAVIAHGMFDATSLAILPLITKNLPLLF